jgi:hypothetical protein
VREIVYFGIFVLLATVACYLFIYYQVTLSQHHWCDALSTLTQNPVPKPVDAAANPSREEGYILYQEFLQLKGDFGCG